MRPARSSTTRRARCSTSMAVCSSLARSTSITSRTALTLPATMHRHGASPDNRAQADAIIQRLESCDNEKQLQAQQNIDPYQEGDGYTPGAIHF